MHWLEVLSCTSLVGAAGRVCRRRTRFLPWSLFPYAPGWHPLLSYELQQVHRKSGLCNSTHADIWNSVVWDLALADEFWFLQLGNAFFLSCTPLTRTRFDVFIKSCGPATSLRQLLISQPLWNHLKKTQKAVDGKWQTAIKLRDTKSSHYNSNLLLHRSTWAQNGHGCSKAVGRFPKDL